MSHKICNLCDYLGGEVSVCAPRLKLQTWKKLNGESQIVDEQGLGECQILSPSLSGPLEKYQLSKWF